MSGSRSTQASNLPSLTFIGFGEAASAFARGVRSEHPDIVISAYDKKTESVCAPVRHEKLTDYETASVKGAETPAEAIAEADAIFSLVTADQALVAAHLTAQTIKSGVLYLDCNSCAPETKRHSAEIIQSAGGRYVDVAVMAPIHPALHKTPLLVSGPHVEAVLDLLGTLGSNVEVIPGDIGTASTVKMIRSIMVKGLEALTLECYLSARTAGVEAKVLQSLEQSYPNFGWTKRIPHMLERTMVHGNRRAEELREVAKTVEALELPHDMATAITEWQQRMGALHLTPSSDDKDQLADQILAALSAQKNNSANE